MIWDGIKDLVDSELKVNPVNKEKLTQLLTTFEKMPDEHINMPTITSCRWDEEMDGSDIGPRLKEIFEGKRKGCGTTACLWGVVPLAFPTEFDYGCSGNPVAIDEAKYELCGSNITAMAAQFIGGTKILWNEIFYSIEASKQEIVEVLRYMLGEESQELTGKDTNDQTQTST